jgi:hypothetical protein
MCMTGTSHLQRSAAHPKLLRTSRWAKGKTGGKGNGEEWKLNPAPSLLILPPYSILYAELQPFFFPLCVRNGSRFPFFCMEFGLWWWWWSLTCCLRARFTRATIELQLVGLLRMPKKGCPDFAQRVVLGWTCLLQSLKTNYSFCVLHYGLVYWFQTSDSDSPSINANLKMEKLKAWTAGTLFQSAIKP